MLERIAQMMTTDSIDEQALGNEVDDAWGTMCELTDSTRRIAGVVGMAAASALCLAVWDSFADDPDDIDLEKWDGEDFMSNEVWEHLDYVHQLAALFASEGCD